MNELKQKIYNGLLEIHRKNAKEIDEAKLPKSFKRLLFIYSFLTMGFIANGEGLKVSEVVELAAKELGISKDIVYNVIKFDRLYVDIRNRYRDFVKKLLKELIVK